jgi:hypothetical protein
MPVLSTPTDALNARIRQQEERDDPFDTIDEVIAAGAPQPETPQPQEPQGDGRPEPSTPQLDLPRLRVDPSRRPEADQQFRRRSRLGAGLGAIGALIGAVGDSPLLTSVGAGIAQGQTDMFRSAERRLRQQQQAFDEFLRQSQQFNRQQATREAQFQAEQQAAGFNRQREQELERELSRFRERLERDTLQQQEERERETLRLEDELEEPTEFEKEIMRRETAAEEQRSAAAFNRSIGLDHQQDRRTGPFDLPRDEQQLRQRRREVEAQIRALQAQQENIPSDVMGERDRVRARQIGERIDELVRQRAVIDTRLQRRAGQRGGQGPGAPSGQQRPGPTGDVQDVINPRRSQQASSSQTGRRAQGRRSSARDTSQAPSRTGAEQEQQAAQQLLQMAPDTTSASGIELLNAYQMVQEGRYSPSAFQSAYGFNPFQ